MVKNNVKTIIGQVIEALPDAVFKVQPDEAGPEILAHLSGKMRIYRIKVLVGDKVKIELSPYGGSRGRIVQRM